MYKSLETEDLQHPVYCLMDIEVKLKGLAYLIESQGSDPCPPFPEDQRDIHRGIGQILGGLSLEITHIRRSIEAGEITMTKRNKRKTRKKGV